MTIMASMSCLGALRTPSEALVGVCASGRLTSSTHNGVKGKMMLPRPASLFIASIPKKNRPAWILPRLNCVKIVACEAGNEARPKNDEEESVESSNLTLQFEKANDLVGVNAVPARTGLKPRVIVIAGPTAIGKTSLSIELAKEMGGEIINADSVQVYQGLDIGAAKATLEERQGIVHHLMDVVPPTVEYTYERFLIDARAATEEILAKGGVPIVVGGTGMYMRWYMHNKQGITSHPFDGEDLTGELDGKNDAEWDYDFQCYFLYQHRADLYPRVDIRCEQMILALLEETSWLLDQGVEPDSNSAAKAIGYEEAMKLLLEARRAEGFISEQKFLEFLCDFQHNSKGLVRKQISWFRNSTRSEVRKFRWFQAGRPVQQMVEELKKEYMRPSDMPSEIPSGEVLKAASLKEQKRMQTYKRALHIFCEPEAIARTLAWIKDTQGPIR